MAVFVFACSPQRNPDNIEEHNDAKAYQAQYRTPSVSSRSDGFLHATRLNAQGCLPFRGDQNGATIGKIGPFVPAALHKETLSRGDLVEIRVEDDEVFSGDYVVSRDGSLKLPFVRAIPAERRSPSDIESALSRALVAGNFYAERPRVSVLLTDFASARVSVSGAVFEPRPIDLGGARGDRIDQRRQAARGAWTESRNLTSALRAAGGVRPDADLSAVELRRAGRVYQLDLRPVIRGTNFDDIFLLTGDEIFVPSRQCFQDWMMVPSPISPPGINLLMSNLTVPANSNSLSAIGKDSRQMPYGSRFMQGVVSANCVGGTRFTRSDRAAALFSRNPLSDVSVVIERRIENMRGRADRDDYDPYLLPGDAIACYDSKITDLADVASIIGLVGAAALVIQ
ncbi:MAG: polysaccharide biosynthesis/export family protein [Planktomarina sp.]